MAAAILLIVWGISAFFFPKLVLEKESGLGQYATIETKAWPQGDAFHLGDMISYFIEVKYNPTTVEGIDKTSIDKNLILEPFIIKSQSEKEFQIDSYTMVFIKEYKLQLVSGELSKLYSFPPLLLNYRLKDSGYFDKKIILQPIPMGSRLPAEVKGLELKPLDGMVLNKSRQGFTAAIIGFGIFCGTLFVIELFRQTYKRKKKSENFQKRLEGIEDIFSNYQHLAANPKKGNPKAALHQAHQILRTLLFRKEGIDWLSPSFECLPADMRHLIPELIAKLQLAYCEGQVAEEELNSALRELGKVFEFYTGKPAFAKASAGKGEEQWKN